MTRATITTIILTVLHLFLPLGSARAAEAERLGALRGALSDDVPDPATFNVTSNRALKRTTADNEELARRGAALLERFHQEATWRIHAATARCRDEFERKKIASADECIKARRKSIVDNFKSLRADAAVLADAARTTTTTKYRQIRLLRYEFISIVGGRALRGDAVCLIATGAPRIVTIPDKEK